MTLVGAFTRRHRICYYAVTRQVLSPHWSITRNYRAASACSTELDPSVLLRIGSPIDTRTRIFKDGKSHSEYRESRTASIWSYVHLYSQRSRRSREGQDQPPSPPITEWSSYDHLRSHYLLCVSSPGTADDTFFHRPRSECISILRRLFDVHQLQICRRLPAIVQIALRRCHNDNSRSDSDHVLPSRHLTISADSNRAFSGYAGARIMQRPAGSPWRPCFVSSKSRSGNGRSRRFYHARIGHCYLVLANPWGALIDLSTCNGPRTCNILRLLVSPRSSDCCLGADESRGLIRAILFAVKRSDGSVAEGRARPRVISL